MFYVKKISSGFVHCPKAEDARKLRKYLEKNGYTENIYLDTPEEKGYVRDAAEVKKTPYVR